MKTRTRFLAASVILAVVCILRSTSADAPNTISDHTLQNRDLEKAISDIRQQVTSWEISAYAQIALTGAVVVIGILITLISGVSAINKAESEGDNKTKSKRNKLVLLILGSLSALAGGINTKLFFPADYRELNKAILDANKIVTRLDGIDAIYIKPNMTDDDLNTLRREFNKEMDRYDKIGERMEGTTEASSSSAVEDGMFSWFILPSVEAQGTGPVPIWTKQTPEDNSSLYFVGTSTDRSLTTAKINSYTSATNQLFADYGLGEPYVLDDSQKTLIKEAIVIQDTYFAFDSSSATFTYSTLLRIRKDLQHPISLPLSYQRSGWYPVDMTFNAVAGLLILDKQGTVSKVSVDRGIVQLHELFRLNPTSAPATIASNGKSIFVSANGDLGCSIFQYQLATAKLTNRLVSHGRGECIGIAADGEAVYLVEPAQDQIRYWADWNSSKTHTFQLPGKVPDQSISGLVNNELYLDARGHRLISAGASGDAYAISLPEGHASFLASNIGFDNSISASKNHILFASGNKVVFVSRSSNRGETTPVSMQSLPGGKITGIAVDSTDSAWIIDFDHSLLKGPYPID